jgi:hypothetical protein
MQNMSCIMQEANVDKFGDTTNIPNELINELDRI